MKNVTKILTVVVLCGAMFASTQRTTALGGNQFWPGDEANIAWFPAQVNSHAFVQLDGVGTDADGTDAGNASILFQKDGTTWGFNYGSDDWVNMHWGDGDMGITFGLANESNNLTGVDLVEKTGYSLGYGNTFSFGELGIHYSDDGTNDATMDVHMKSDFGFWLFDDTYVGIGDLTGDMKLRADFYSHMDAGGADVVYGWGLNMDMADVGFMHQTATLGVEANMTDWATLRVGYNWNHVLSADDTPAVAASGDYQADSMNCGDNSDAACDDMVGSAAVDIMVAKTGVSSGGFQWGLGFNWGGLTADMSVNSSLLQDPIGTVTGFGNAVTDKTITVTYSF